MNEDMEDGVTRAHLPVVPPWVGAPRFLTGAFATAGIFVGLAVIAVANGSSTGQGLPGAPGATGDAVAGQGQFATTFGIALATLGAVVLVGLFVVVASSALGARRRPTELSAGASAGRARELVSNSVARQLSTLARLHSRGQLSDAEFAAAKRHLLDL